MTTTPASLQERESELLSLAIIEHLGPAALSGGKLSQIEAFELGWRAARAIPPLPVAPELGELRKLAMKATPGEWRRGPYGGIFSGSKGPAIASGSLNGTWCRNHSTDENFIAAANPATIIKLLDALAARPVVPEGWVLVPVEPTEEMLVFGQEAWMHAKAKGYSFEDCTEATNVYRDMILAAPTPPGAGQEEEL